MELENHAKTNESVSSLKAEPYPWLFYCHGKRLSDQTFLNIDKKTYSRRFPELRGCCPLGSCHGWCLFKDNECGDMFFWNPLSLEKISLPPLKFNQSAGQFVLSAAPTSTDCTVFLFLCDRPIVIFYRLGIDNQWNFVNYKKELELCLQIGDQIIRDPVFVGGKMYATTLLNDIVLVIDEIKQDTISIRVLHVADPILTSLAIQDYFVECVGKLFMIQIKHGGIDFKEVFGVEAYSLNCTSMMWENVDSLKDFTFFLGINSSLCVDTPNKGGHIYISPNCMEQKLWYYDSENRCIGILSSVWGLEISCPIWLKPQYDSVYQGGPPFKAESKIIHRLKDEDASVETEPHFGRVHTDMVALMVERLPLADYWNFRTTCREFHLIMPPVFNLETALTRRQGTTSLYPWFVFQETSRSYTIFDPLNNDKYQMKLPELLHGCNISCVKDGWLLMDRASESFETDFFFFNPLTKEILQLPRCGIYDTIGVFDSPNSSECLVAILNTCDSEGSNSISSIHPKDTKWTKRFLYDEAINNFEFYRNTAVFYEGSIYCLGQGGNIGRLEPKEYTWHILSQPLTSSSWYEQLFLVECDRELLSIFVGYYGERVRVFKLNQSTSAWTRVKSLGDHMICISRSSSFSTVARYPGMRNKIFFPRFHDQSIVYYSLHTGKFHSFDGKDSIVDFCKTKKILYCGWFEPNWC